MKLQRTTLILILLALGLGSFVYFSEVQSNRDRQEVSNQQQIFSFEAEQVQELKVKTKDATIGLERVLKSGKFIWLIKDPDQAEASDAAVSYLMNLLVKGKSDRTLYVPANQLQQYGLDQPQATIQITLKNQQTHQMILGKSDFNDRFLYAQVDPPTKQRANVNVLLVSPDFANAVNRPLSEWKQTQIEIPKDTSDTNSTSSTSDKLSPSPSPSKEPSTTSDQTIPSPSPSKEPSTTSDKPSPSPSPSNTSPQQSDKPSPSPPQASDKPSPSPP